VIYRLLGELEIGPDDHLLDLPSGPTLIILAALLVNANRQISKPDLIRVAWGEDGVQEAQLHKRVMAVRDLLAAIDRRDALKTHPRFGYELRVAEDDVDALLFRRLVREAGEAGEAGRGADESGLLRKALRLWRGPHPLSNVPGEALRMETVALEQRHKRAAARLFELELGRGRHAEILDELMTVAAFYPADRRLCEQLMAAASRSGHPAEAMSTYERYRDALAEETGADPDPLLRNWYFAIARGDDAGIAAAEAALAGRVAGPVRVAAAIPRQLPRPVELVGRGDLVAEVSWLLTREPQAAVPLVVISGPGGIGKTALALRAAHESSGHYPDGQLFAELRDTGGDPVDTGEVLAQFLRAFGVARVPETKAERLADYRTMLASRRVLVVLDDAADGTVAAELLPAHPGCGVLITAHQRLPDIGGAHHVAPLEPLDQVDATELFLRVVSEAGISIDDDLEAIDQVVTLCSGLPLALRIAGALRVHDHPRPTRELAERLARQGPEGLTHGQLSVARSIGAGFERLDAAAGRLFLGLGLLPMPEFALWTAAALLDEAPADAVAAISQLTASFMIDPVESGLRYRFHDLTREYAGRRAATDYPGDRDAVPGRVYRALLTLARRAHAALYGGDFEIVHSGVPDWDAPPDVLAAVAAAPLDWFEAERLNIRAAVEHCAALGLTGICWDLAVSAHEFYTIRSYFDDWNTTHTVALRACQKAHDRLGEGILLTYLNQPALVVSRRQAGPPRAADLRRAVDLLTECGNRHGQAIALRTLGNALLRQGHLAQPLELFTAALGHYEASGDTVGQWLTLRYIGQARLYLGQYREARRTLGEAETLAGEQGSERLIAQSRYWIGQTCLAEGDLDGAAAAFGAVLEGYGDDAGTGHAYALHGLGNVARLRGAWSLAGQHFSAAADLARSGADSVLHGRVWLSIAALRAAEGRPGDQVAALERAAAALAGCGADYLEAQALTALAAASADRGDTDAATAARQRAEQLYLAAGLSDEDRSHHRPDL
jgi:DNA-binding SARP family transcriptional activator/tetratricopeptide (TPR) repeat protein